MTSEAAQLDREKLDLVQATVPVQAAMGPAVTLTFDQLLAFAKDVVTHATEDVTYENPEDVQEMLLEAMKQHGLADVVLCDHEDCNCPDPDTSIGYWAFTPLLSETIHSARVTADPPSTLGAGGSLEHHTLSPADLEIQRLRKALDHVARHTDQYLRTAPERDPARKKIQHIDAIAREALERKP